jgi:hypothetical protein
MGIPKVDLTAGIGKGKYIGWGSHPSLSVNVLSWRFVSWPPAHKVSPLVSWLPHSKVFLAFSAQIILFSGELHQAFRKTKGGRGFILSWAKVSVQYGGVHGTERPGYVSVDAQTDSDQTFSALRKGGVSIVQLREIVVAGSAVPAFASVLSLREPGHAMRRLGTSTLSARCYPLQSEALRIWMFTNKCCLGP